MKSESKESVTACSQLKASSSADLASTCPGSAHAQSGHAKSSWGSLFAFTQRTHVRVLLAAIVASGATAALRTALAIFLGRIFDIVADRGNGLRSGPNALEAVSRWCLVLVGLGLGNWLANAAFLALWTLFGELQADSARCRVFQSLLTRDLAWFDMLDQGTSGLLVRIQTQTRELQAATSQIFGFLVCDALTSCASLIIALYYSWRITLVLLATLPLSLIVLSLATRQLEPAIRAQKAHLEKATRLTTASVTAIDLVKVFNGFDRELRHYRNALRWARRHYLVQARCNSTQMGYIAFWVVAMFVLGFWYGSILVRDGLPPGHVVTTFYSTLAAFQGIEALVPHWLVLSKGMSAGSFLSSIAAKPETSRSKALVDTAPRTTRLEHCVGDVQLNSVSFAYPSNPATTVLDTSSFAFPAGQTTFLVGKSGSGKSTVGSLLAKLYEPLAGQILIDGRPLELLDDNWVRENITLVQQSSILFSDSLFNNIALGNPSPEKATLKEVLGACQAALLQSTLASLPQGLDTQVGPRGFELSGGQKQKVALARARLRNPTILILDEITSGLDQVGRALVMDAIREWRRDKTTIIITHDTSNIDDDEYVYVMDNASVVREGFKRDLPEDQKDLVLSSYQLHQHAAYGRDLPITAFIPGPAERRRFSAFINNKFFPAPEREPDDQKGCPTNIETSLEEDPSDTSGEDDVDFIFGAAERRENIPRLRLRARALESANPPLASQKPAEKASLLSILATLWPTLGQFDRLLLVLGLMVCLIGAVSTPAFAYCLAQLMGVMWSSGEKAAEGQKWAICLVVVAVTDGLCTGGSRYLLENVGQAWVDGIRVQALARIMQQPKSWFDGTNHSPGRINERLERNAEEMRNIVGRFVPIVVVVTTIMSISLLWALATSWRLTLVALAPLPVVFATVKGYASVSSEWESKCNEGAEDCSAALTEILLNLRVVRALTLEAHFAQRYRQCAKHTLRLGMRRAKHTSWLFGLYQSMSYALTALVFYYSTSLLAQDTHADVASVVQVVNLLLFSIGTSSEILNGIPQLTMAQAAAAPLLGYANLPLDRPRQGQAATELDSPLPLRMHDLTFSYPRRATDPVLNGVSLGIVSGECTVIVGQSGCGKSTLVSLLLGLHAAPEPSDPANAPPLSFAGVSCSNVDLQHLRSTMAYVPQSPFLFPATITENIAYGLAEDSPHRHIASIAQAAQAAGLHDFIASLPEGYNTVVGDGGLALSGGQAQRLSIARALVRQPRLLVMDEPTSALDADSSQTVRRTITRLVQQTRTLPGGMAVVLVTHSRDVMRLADRLIVLSNGIKVDEGSYQALARKKGPFLDLISGGQWAGDNECNVDDCK
ncbi:ABC transporter transmembrane domain-containing protein [Hirsutella rhossiliensis]|uniref:ABC transporter transmembrane domain-containing protein n=1 Tax=Hirsutella rhossiliensis TaxID=111463 RepID=A0A9P8N1J0_9HYPO|nr:ABC transporter transmembrane domain-containing protein [Hirsutella rhossiliensis]KAH0964897.1 ABC transporter transmembrane domain-containing protein [Hirsutella rhossiliensis]